MKTIKKENNQILGNQEQFHHLIDMSPNIIFVYQEGRIVFANTKATRIIGGNNAGLIGKSIKDLFGPKFEEKISSLLKKRDEDMVVGKLISLDGREIYLQTSVVEVNFNSNKAIMVVGQDITSTRKILGGETELFHYHADMAIREARKAGKNKYTPSCDYEQSFTSNPLKMEMDLYEAIERNELLLHYQPRVDLKTGNIIGVEALVRWNHGKFGIIPPGSFISIAEESGLINPIGEWTLFTACKQNKEWHRKGFLTVVSVNLSPLQFTKENFVETVERALRETGLEPSYLELEITENMTVDIDRTIGILDKLKKLGVRISIDNFGTGFSSLSYLKQFPLDSLKIDQSFVQKLYQDPNDETIVKTIISMAHNLNLSVVAKGIETREQLLFLQEYLCEEGQGYFFTKALPAAELEERYYDIQKKVKEFGLSETRNEHIWMQEMLRKARKELSETIRFQQGMIFKYKLINGEFIHTLCDGELLYRMGLVPSQVVGKSLFDFLPHEFAVDKLSYYERAWNGEEHLTYENESEGIFYLAALSPVRRGGEVVEVIGSCVDITERKRVEKELQESQKKYRTIADNMNDLVSILDIKGKVLYASPSHETVLGHPIEYYEGKNALHYIHPNDQLTTSSIYQQIMEEKLAQKSEVRIKNKDQEWKLFEFFSNPVLGDHGEVEHIVVTGRDITEKRTAEEQLWKAEKLQLVGELAAGVAHEIRNPITAIKGFIQLFQRGMIKDEYFDVILGEFDRIEDIIKEFLSLAKNQEMKPSFASIPVLLKEVETLLESEANLMNIQFSMELESNVPQIMCDPNQLKQVFINIIKNSIESIQTDGLIKIRICTEEDFLVVKISDNGIGISEERLQRLGEPFYSNKEKGTGLGLMISFRIIKQHNGTITFKSKENQGTTVEIRLPKS
ncbi:MAG: EAL domain-containing protein [Neobacillus sp.]